MYNIKHSAHTIYREGGMKDLFMLAGFGLGLITGAMLYKYSKETKKAVDNGEKKVMQEAEMLSKKAEKGVEKLEEGIKKGTKKIQKKMNSAKKG